MPGWVDFYRYVDFRARVIGKIDRMVFWRFAHWLGRKHRTRIAVLLRKRVWANGLGVQDLAAVGCKLFGDMRYGDAGDQALAGVALAKASGQ